MSAEVDPIEVAARDRLMQLTRDLFTVDGDRREAKRKAMTALSKGMNTMELRQSVGFDISEQLADLEVILEEHKNA